MAKKKARAAKPRTLRPVKPLAIRSAISLAASPRPVRLRINSGDANWVLLGDIIAEAPGNPVAGKDVQVRRTLPADVSLLPGTYTYSFDANGGKGNFELEAVFLPSASLAKDTFNGPDVLEFKVP
jgi:hypothetical protein